MLELVFLPFAILISVPGGAFLPTALLGTWVLRRWSGLSTARRTVAGAAVAVWVVYACYETWMYFWMKSVVAPIRVDLLLVVPVLIVVTGGAVWAGRRETRGGRRGGGRRGAGTAGG